MPNARRATPIRTRRGSIQSAECVITRANYGRVCETSQRAFARDPGRTSFLGDGGVERLVQAMCGWVSYWVSSWHLLAVMDEVDLGEDTRMSVTVLLLV